MADLTHTVDPDGTGDYVSLSALEAAQQQDLTDGGGDTYTAKNISSSGTDDTTQLTWDGWVTAAANYAKIIVEQANRHAGVWDAAKPVLGPITGDYTFKIRDQYIRVEGLQVGIEDVGNRVGIEINLIAGGGSDIRISHCLVQGSGNNSNHGINVVDADATVKIYNNIIYNCAGVAVGKGIRIDNGVVDVWNNTVVDCAIGIYRGAGTVNVDMNLVSDCTDAFLGTFAGGEENAYTEGGDPANNGNSVTRGNEFTFENYAGDDFHIDASFDGTTDQSGGVVTDDIDGNARSGTFDIGADEYVAVGAGLSLPIAMAYYSRIRRTSGD